MTEHTFGWIKDDKDARDYLYRPTVMHLPAAVDLKPLCSVVEDQGQLGSCVGNASVGALELLENKYKVKPFLDLSRLFVYLEARRLEGTVSEDAGCMIRDAVKVLAGLGVCDEKLWPYNIKKFAVTPPKADYKDALKHRISVYQKVSGLTGLKTCLATGFPVVFGFTVYESFETINRNGIMPVPNPRREAVLGGHAVVAVGYDDAKGYVTVRNSWSPSWGSHGYFYMGYSLYSKYASDCWMISK
jgi:C1A family cysteine protease